MDDWSKFHQSNDRFDEYRVRDYGSEEPFHKEAKKKQQKQIYINYA